MKMTEEGLALIKRFEGFRGTAYRCPAGVWTIGYGHTSQAGPPAVAAGQKMSRAIAHDVLAVDVEKFAAAVSGSLRRELTDEQFSALVSFAYNVGPGNFRSSSVLKAANAGDMEAVPRRLQLWIKGGGRVLPGLVTRRAAEAEFFIRGSKAAPSTESTTPAPMDGKPLNRSTTALAALVSALAALASGMIGTFSNARIPGLLLVIIVVLAAGWIIRERLRKAKEDGI